MGPEERKTELLREFELLQDVIRASELSRLGRDSEALRVLDGVLARDPANASALSRRALIYANLGEPDLALAAAQAATGADPHSAFAFWVLGNIHLRENRPAEGIAPARESIRLNPTDHLAHQLLACLLLEIAPTEALAPAEHARGLNPAAADAHETCGQVYQKLGRTADARAEYLRALELEPDRTISHYLLAKLDQADRDWRSALDGFRRALHLDPGMASSRMAAETIIQDRVRLSAATVLWLVFIVAIADAHGLAGRVLTSVLLGIWAGLTWLWFSAIRERAGSYARHLLRTNSGIRARCAITVIGVVGLVLLGLVQVGLGTAAARYLGGAALGLALGIKTPDRLLRQLNRVGKRRRA
jgi:tetratricopeptide (TPR) repeat protein